MYLPFVVALLVSIQGNITLKHRNVYVLQGCLCCLLFEVLLCVCDAKRLLDLSVISEGGYFKAHLVFPMEYPQRPPKMKFVSDIWHPNGEWFDLCSLLRCSVVCMCVYYVY